MSLIWVTKTGAGPGDPDIAGAETLYAPLLEVAPPPDCPAPPPLNAALVFSSKNGLHWFCALTDRRHWPVYCVGDATAASARAKGFKNVKSAGKDVQALAALIISSETGQTRPIYYAGPAEPSGDLIGDLQKQGFTAIAAVFYETRPVSRLSQRIMKALKTEEPFTVLLYSAKGANAFTQLIPRGGDISIISLSAAVDQAVKTKGLRARMIAKSPDETALIACLP